MIMKRYLVIFFILILILFLLLFALSIRENPEDIDYGVSFSVFRAEELELDWRKVYDAIIDDLGAKRLRLVAHWPMIEPENNRFNWTELDYQINRAEANNVEVVLAIGRRLPGWPECHEPGWVQSVSSTDKESELYEYLAAVVNRYKNSKAITYWQIENEPFLTAFARHICGDFLTKKILKSEIDLVRSLDPDRPIIVTDSGELSLWYQAYGLGDAFGTSLYLYVWNHYVGPIKYPITPAFFKIKRNLVEMFMGPKEVKLIELSLEPWLLQPIIETPFEIALKQMNIDRFNEILIFAKESGFQEQYLWGAEWWYFMRENDHPEFWDRARGVFKQ